MLSMWTLMGHGWDEGSPSWEKEPPSRVGDANRSLVYTANVYNFTSIADNAWVLVALKGEAAIKNKIFFQCKMGSDQ